MNDWIQSFGYTVIDHDPSSEFFDVCIIDHYSLQAEDEDQFRKYCKKLVSIDDWGTRFHRVDLIIDPSISRGSIVRKKSNPDTPFEAGPEWLMIRDEFKQRHLRSHSRAKFEKILIFFGGTDPADQIVPYILASNELIDQLSHLQLVFLISKYHPRVEEIGKMRLNGNQRIMVNPDSVSEVLSGCDFYLGSCGTITWERMCLGLPGMGVSVVENQVDLAETLDEMGLQVYLGKSTDVEPKKALMKMLEVLKNETMLREQSSKALQLVDGSGISRIKNRICGLASQ